ncbi:hypothetical protein GCM10010349_78300 [Streptomyces flavofungini]|nr:hypothetical protein GCM10010349_78300 [Streptomyces flavofungini]
MGKDCNHTHSSIGSGVGPVEVKVARDTSGTFEPQSVRKRQRRLTGVDEMALPLSAKGLTHGEIATAHLAEVYGAEVSKQTISSITGTVTESWPSGRTGPSTASIRFCSWTPSTSRPGTGRSRTVPSAW